MSKYPDDMDKECIKICDVLNFLPGIVTFGSCCGHGKNEFQIHFSAKEVNDLIPILFSIDPCHLGMEGWGMEVFTDCAASTPYFTMHCFLSKGKKACMEADVISEYIKKYLKKEDKKNE